MITSRGMRWPSQTFKDAPRRTSLPQPSRPSRSFFSTQRNATHTPRLSTSLLRPRPVYSNSHDIFRPLPIRYASTSSPAGPASAASSPVVTSTTSQTETIDSGLNWSFDEILNAQDRIGGLYDMGLDYGWGPTSMVQYAYEALHVSFGLPWWAVITTFTVITRLAIFPIQLRASEEAVKLGALKPILAPIQKRVREAGKDMAARTKATQEMRQVYRDANVKFSRTFMPAVIQIPIGFGCFRLLRGMAYAPILSMQTQGILWFTDLTAYDPTMGLPVLSAAALYAGFSLNRKMGIGTTQSSAVQGFIQYGIPAITFLIGLRLPAGINLLILVGGILQGIQSYVLAQKEIRRLLSLSPLPTPQLPNSKTTFVDGKAVDTNAAAAKAREQMPAWKKPLPYLQEKLDPVKKAKDSFGKEVEDRYARYTGTAPGMKTKREIAEEERYEKRRAAEDAERDRREKEAAKARRRRN